MSTPNYQFGQPKWKREGWYSPTQQYRPKCTISLEEVLDPTPDPIPSSHLEFRGVTIREDASSGYLFMGDLRKAAPGLGKVPYSNWSEGRGKEVMHQLSTQLGIPVPELVRVESRKSTWIHPAVAQSWASGYSPELYRYLKQARPQPEPSGCLVASIAPAPTVATAPDSTVQDLEAKVLGLEDLVNRLLARVQDLESRPQPALPTPAPSSANPAPRKSHYSVSSWLSLKGIQVRNRGEAGKALTSYCMQRNLGYQRVETDGGPYTHVNEYPVSALEALDWSQF